MVQDQVNYTRGHVLIQNQHGFTFEKQQTFHISIQFAELLKTRLNEHDKITEDNTRQSSM